MSITLEQFRTISNGSYNVGQIMLNQDESGLEKINNHVWQTKKNNVQTSAADNRKVRQALLDAFKADAQVPEALKSQIEYILLGEGRATRSLGRDFVKKLIATATDANNAADNIINAMETVEKRLRDRTVTQTREPNNALRELMTSTDDVSFQIYASEAMDRAAAKVHDSIVKMLSPTGNLVANISAGAMDAYWGLSNMLQEDRRLVENPNVQPLSNELKELARNFFAENRSVINSSYGREKAVAIFERKVRALYDKHNIPADVRDDHYARVFTRSSVITEGADELRKLLDDVSTGLIYGFEENADKANLAKLYLKVLDAVIVSVQSDDSLKSPNNTIVIDCLKTFKGTVDHPSERLMEFQGLGDKAFSPEYTNNKKALVEMVEKHLLKDIDDAFYGIAHGQYPAFQRKQALVLLGLGV